jgi:deoxyribodipyrimidine photo-lyase
MYLHILWYKKDLRIKDHAPLFFAAQAEEVLPIYVFEPSVWKSKDMSFRHLNLVIESLVDLQIQFEYGKKVLYSLKKPIPKPKENRDDSISLFDSFEE